ncbi:unnamed protein product [Lathyrus sativus]|nr:unnamed protein product [Lathyrus sativus]
MDNLENHHCNRAFGMTNEQIEILRKQIAVYAYISELLIQRHNNFSSCQHFTSGARMKLIYDPLLINKISLKQRWKPTNSQIQALEQIYAADQRTPNKERIKKITVDLSKFGPISEFNVYIWFQNRRARLKKKKNNVDVKSKVEIKVNSKDKKIEQNKSVASSSDKNLGHQNSQVNSDFSPYLNPELEDLFAIL